jgi:hypothetical protein
LRFFGIVNLSFEYDDDGDGEYDDEVARITLSLVDDVNVAAVEGRGRICDGIGEECGC